MNMRGEESPTSHVASLITLILVLIIIYMIFIPSAAREDILEGRGLDDSYGAEDGGRYSDSGDSDVDILLITTPGRVYPSSSVTDTKKIPSLSLYNVVDTSSKRLANSFRISRSLIKNTDRVFKFTLDDLASVDGLGLFFRVDDKRGRLNVELNNNLIYTGIGGVSELPINLPVINLEQINILRFEVDTRGSLFSSDYFDLADVELIFKDRRINKEESRKFYVTKNKLDVEQELSYYVNCIDLREGLLNIDLNNRNVFNGRIVCDAARNTVEIDKDYFLDGLNEMSFSIDQGNYVLEDIELDIELKGGNSPIYYFDVDKDDWDETFLLQLDLLEVDDLDVDIIGKRAEFLVNGDRFSMFTERDFFEKDISNFVKKGENYIKVLPRNEFEIVNLQVVME